MLYIIRLRPFLISLGTSVGTVFFAMLLNASGFSRYESLYLPPGAPSGWVLGAVWMVLSVLMGVSAYLLWQSDSPKRRRGMRLYIAQLVVNFLWPVWFFTLRWDFFSFLWVLLLGVLVAAFVRTLLAVQRIAAYLQIPYLVWLVFTAYWNFGVFVLN